jgi:hypothetical protein
MDRKGWLKMFELGADNPAAWLASAENLLRASKAVAREAIPVGDGLVDVIVGVQAMLVA